MRRLGARAGLLLALASCCALLAGAPAAAKTRSVPDSGVVTLGTAHCEASEACALLAPRQVTVRVAGVPLRARVLAPAFVGRGGKAEVKLRFDSAALARFAGRAATFRFQVVLRAAGERQARTFSARLRRQAAAAAGGGGAAPAPATIRSESIAGEPLELPRPATAVTVGDVKLTWYPRDSWLRYAASGVAPGDGILFSAGSTGINSAVSPCPDRSSASDAQIPYTVEFSPRESWFDPLSGTAAVDGTGSVTFRWRAHTIDLTGSDPEIQINGAASQAVFRFSGSEGTSYPNQRVALLTLDTAGRPTVSGNSYTYSLMRGRLSGDGEKVFAGFYTAPDNNEFGCVSVGFTVP